MASKLTGLGCCKTGNVGINRRVSSRKDLQAVPRGCGEETGKASASPCLGCWVVDGLSTRAMSYCFSGT